MTVSAAPAGDAPPPGAARDVEPGLGSEVQHAAEVPLAREVPGGGDVRHPYDDGDPASSSPLDVHAPRYTVAAVARRLGVAPATLRTWARRYGLGPSEHTLGAHRRYSVADLARLQRMRRLVVEGVAPSDAARLALAGESPVEEEAVAPSPERPLAALPPSGAGRGEVPPARSGGRAGGPGGRVLAMPTGSAAARGLARAAMALDDEAVTGLLRDHLRRDGARATWEDVVAPVLVAVGQRWAATGEGVDVEHLLSECVGTVLREAVAARGLAGRPRPVLLACAADDQHALPLAALAAALAERGVPARLLGAAMPVPGLVSAVRRTGPVALFLWSQVRATADPRGLETLPALRPPVRLVLGGPGWRLDELPEGARHARDLGEAVDLLVAATGR